MRCQNAVRTLSEHCQNAVRTLSERPGLCQNRCGSSTNQVRGLVVGLGSSPLGLGASPSPLPPEHCVRVEACACWSTAARGWHCDEGCARPRRARHGSARRAYQRQLSRHGNAYPGSSSEPGRRRRDATAAHSTSSARCPAVSPAARSDGRRLARCSAPWPQTEERPRGVCDVRCGV